MIINKITPQVSFGRAFTTQERQEADKIKDEALRLLGNKERILIVPEFSMPKDKDAFLGYGQLNTKNSYDFIELMKSYTGATTIKVLPQGEYYNKGQNAFYPAYKTSSLTLGTQLINLQDLTTPEYSSILSPKTLTKIINNNSKHDNLAKIENLFEQTSGINEALKEAHNNLTYNSFAPLNLEFQKYKKTNYEILEKKALYDILVEKYNQKDFMQWPNQIDKELFDKEKVDNAIRESRIKQIKSENTKQFDFLLFKQFLAEKNLQKARATINSKNMKLMGDCQVAFSFDEIWGYPKAFEKHASICSSEWNIRAINYQDVLKEGTEARNLLKLKVSQFAKRYDAIRFDIGWGYVEPILHPKKGFEIEISDRYIYDSYAGGYKPRKPLGGGIIDFIENTVKEVQGDSFDKSNLIYEIETGKGGYTPYIWDNNVATGIKDVFKGRRIVQSNFHMHQNYATIDFFENMNVSKSDFVYMSGNHDNLALNALAQKIDNDNMIKNMYRRSEPQKNVSTIFEEHVKELSKKLNIDAQELRNNPTLFTKAKWSYLLFTENIKMFFMDVFGRTEQFDSQSNNKTINYRYMIPENFEEAYHSSVQSGNGFNIYDAIARTMKSKGLDQGENKNIFDNIVKYAKLLAEDGVKTEVEANKIFNITPPKDKTTKILLASFGTAILSMLGLKYYFVQKKNEQNNQININK